MTVSVPLNGAVPAEPAVRIHDGVDMSFEDVPYPVVPAFTRRPVVHLAVECQGVDWNRGMSIRVLVRTRCGKSDLFADRRCMSWVAECRRCFPRSATESAAPAGPAPAVDVPEPLAEPRAHDWDDDPHTCGIYDRRYWNRDED